MCGIVGFAGKNDGVNFLLEGLCKLEYRGYDSSGIALYCNDEIKIIKTVGRIEKLAEKCKSDKVSGNAGIGHTRWATHGKPSEENSHPHLSNNLKFAVVHNGIIENYIELRQELEQEGFVFKSETDTEVIPNLLQKYYNGDLKNAVNKTISRIKGSYALGILCKDYPDMLVAVKQFSPIIIGIADDCNIIASDVTAIAPKTQKIIYIEDGDVAYITANSVEIYSDSLMVERRISIIDWDINTAEKGGYGHFMMKEIYEQPAVLRRILKEYLKDNEICFPNINIDKELIKEIDRIVIIACGSAYHAGVAAKYLFEEITGIPTEVDLASEFRYRNPIITEKTLTIAISQSGETADTIAALTEAKRRGSKTACVVNAVGSSIAKIADNVIYTLAGPEIAVATTKGYTSQLLCLYLLAIFMAEKISLDHKAELIKELNKLPSKTEEVLSVQEKIADVAKRFTKTKSIFFIGRNMDFAAALEASLKLKEISYIHSEAFAAGELKHGTISLIEEGTHVIALCGYERLNDKLLSNIREVIARGADVLCAANNRNMASSVGADLFSIPKTHPLFTALAEVVPFQIFAYYVALYKGCDIDKPRNLAKSVTVE